MHIVHVQIIVKPEMVEEFRSETIENARNSIKESGIVQFEFIQNREEPERFILVEVYKTPADQLAHRETPHYQKWKSTVADMMAEPRVGIIYQNIYPEDSDWRKNEF